jgi:hypothetical protein
MLYQDNLSGTILAEANKQYSIRRQHGGSFALLQFDWDNGKYARRLSGHNKDPEHMFCKKFGEYVGMWGKPTDVIFITMYTPCDRVCSEQIGNLAITYPFIRRILVFFFEVYRGESVGENVSAFEKLGTGVMHSPDNTDANDARYTMIRSEMILRGKKKGTAAALHNLQANATRLGQVSSAMLGDYFS